MLKKSKLLRSLFAIFCLSLLMFSTSVSAAEVDVDHTEKESTYFTATAHIGDHDRIGPGDALSEYFTLTNTTDKLIRVRVYEVNNIGNSELYDVLQTGWVGENNSVTYASFDDLAPTGWEWLSPGESVVLHLSMYFPLECQNVSEAQELHAQFVFEVRVPFESVQTGDYVDLLGWLLLMLLALVLILLLILILVKKKKKDQADAETAAAEADTAAENNELEPKDT